MEKPLGCLSFSGLLIAALTLVVLGSLIFAQGGAMFSPGELNAQVAAAPLGGVRSHAELKYDCGACHTAPWLRTVMSDRCLECHINITTEISDFQSLHGVLMAEQGAACYACHTEHNGPDAIMTVIQTENFPHEVVGFSLEGHAQFADGTPFACADCHQDGVAVFGLAACEECHASLDADFTQFHVAAFGQECLDCHDGIDTYGADFDHNQFFVLEGEHASGTCGGCHPGVRTMTEFRAAPHDCYACHAAEDEHNGEFGFDCAVCHTPADWEQATFDHAQTNFPLEGEHVNVACEDCHQNNLYEGTPQDCYACHAEDDEHNGQYGSDCAACHTPVDWKQATFDHNLSNFPLEGEHINVACEDCHQNGVYQGTPQDCYACHAEDDEHNGQYGSECAACHTPIDWEQATFDHTLTAFPLTGAHNSVDCADCHQNSVYAGTPQECVACHADPVFHQGLFSSVCTDCHTTTAWSPAEYNQSHTFPFNHGESGVSACTVCHDPTLNTYTCYSCHEHTPANIDSKHREEGINNYTNCMECHPTGREDEGDHGGDDD